MERPSIRRTEDGGSKGSAGKGNVCLGSVIALDNHYTMMKNIPIRVVAYILDHNAMA